MLLRLAAFIGFVALLMMKPLVSSLAPSTGCGRRRFPLLPYLAFTLCSVTGGCAGGCLVTPCIAHLRSFIFLFLSFSLASPCLLSFFLALLFVPRFFVLPIPSLCLSSAPPVFPSFLSISFACFLRLPSACFPLFSSAPSLPFFFALLPLSDLPCLAPPA